MLHMNSFEVLYFDVCWVLIHFKILLQLLLRFFLRTCLLWIPFLVVVIVVAVVVVVVVVVVCSSGGGV